MRPTWATQYLKLPFVDRGRDRAWLDCYGLVRLIYAEQRGILLPSYTEGYTTDRDQTEIVALSRGEIATHWKTIRLEDVQLFDGVILRVAGQPIHFGMVLDHQYFIHTMRGIWSVMERWQSLTWQHRIVGAVRYDG